jgi:D-alanyl-D-alanine carboxypeptidase
MNRSIAHVTPAGRASDTSVDGGSAGILLISRVTATSGLRAFRRFRLIACLALLATLAACGGSQTHRTARYNPSRYYPPPGPSSDPWGPYVREASGRFGVPENWVRRVMHQESGGQEDVISWAGAMGLMQVMPDTYDGLRTRYSLGDDPFDPHNNILAGTAYLREMYDRFGSPGFLAAYNAGPNRLDRYLNSGTPLPPETVNYVASIAPLLGADTPMSGPLAVYAGGASVTRAVYRPTPAGCDPDAAYDPARPCAPVRPAVVQVAAAAPAPFVRTDCDPDAAYDPTRPCAPIRLAPVQAAPGQTAPAQIAAVAAPYVSTDCDPDAAYDPRRRCAPPAPAVAPIITQPLAPPPSPAPARYAREARPLQERMTQPAAFAPGPPPGHWMIQVGAFATLSTAQGAAERARALAPDLLDRTKIELPATAPLGTQVAFRARLSGLTPQAAAEACARLARQGMACITVPPPQGSF